MTTDASIQGWVPPAETEWQQAGRHWDAVRLQLCREDCGAERAVDLLGETCGAVLHDRVRHQLYWLIETGSAAGWDPPPGVAVLTAPSWLLVAPVYAERSQTIWRVPPLPGRHLTPAADLAVALGLALGPGAAR